MRIPATVWVAGWLCAATAWGAKWEGRLRVDPGAAPWVAGQPARLSLQAAKTPDGPALPGALAGRTPAVWLIPYRFNLFDNPVSAVTVRPVGGDDIWTVEPPALEPGWYLLLCTVTDDDGRPVTVERALAERATEPFLARAVVAIAAPSARPFYRVHTERARCVFAPGEVVRLCVSARNAPRAAVTLVLAPRAADAAAPAPAALTLATPTLAGDATAVVDLTAEQTRRLAPGDYELQVLTGGAVADRYPIRLVSPAPAAGGLRWAHTMPFGNAAGLDDAPALPQQLASGPYGGMIGPTLARIHRANHWVNFFAVAYPVVGPDHALPHAADPRLPPAVAAYRPSLTHAFYQRLMAEGISLGICAGYGEDYKAEVYMPIPTVMEDQIAVLARKYLAAGLGAACLPHVTSLYTDYYGHMDFDGAGEIEPAALDTLRRRLWDEAVARAGMRGAEPPHRYPTERDDLPADLRARLKDGAAARAWDAFVKARREAAGGGRDWFAESCTNEAARAAFWRDAWAAAGIAPAPAAPRAIPLPTLDPDNAARFGAQAAYDYASHALRGIERAYGALTRRVEAELPAVFTIHNKGTMNHSSVGHAWTGTRTPNVDPAYLDGGATAIAVSEWNLDGVPKPYFLPTFYNQFLLDRGHPVYQCGLWKQMGGPARFMRDAIFWGGRQIQTYFDQAGNMTWSHKGADQTTYAANERLAAVTEVLTWYADLFPQLEPVREVGLYVPPVGGPWGAGVTRGHYVATLAALMSDHQVHFVSHGDIPEGRLKQYPVLFAPSLHDGNFVPFEAAGFRAFIAGGGRIVGSMAPDYFHPEAVYRAVGIVREETPQLDPLTGEPRRDKSGAVRMETRWQATPDQWARACRAHVWGAFPEGVTVAPIDVHKHFTHLDADGREATWAGSHWTDHHKWAGYRGAALHQYRALKAVLDAAHEPIVRKDQPEVFVNLCRPKDGWRGLFLFASNWTLPDQPDLYRARVPQGFFNSAVKPVGCTLAVKSDEVGAVYDLIASRAVPFERRDGRVVFRADLDSVEGRIYALLPEPVDTVRLELPATVASGAEVRGRFRLIGAAGRPLNVATPVRFVCADPAGRPVLDVCRTLDADGNLPVFTAPVLTGDHLTVTVTDPLSGHVARSRLAVQSGGLGPVASPEAVTVFRGDRIREWFKAHPKGIRIVVDEGALTFGDDGQLRAGAPAPHAATERAWAAQLQQALKEAGIAVEVTGNRAAVTGPLWAHPWRGEMARYRSRHTVPDQAMKGPVMIVGAPESNQYLAQMERAWVAGRELGGGNTAGDRAVIAWAPGAFAPDADAVLVAASGPEGLANAAAALRRIVATGAEDGYYRAREAVRAQWLPREVRQFKQARGILPPAPPVPAMPPGEALAPVEVTTGWNALAGVVGAPIFDLDAGPNGVAVGTKSWIKPTGLVKPDGAIVGFWGGGAEVTPRDVGVSADGAVAAAGYSLLGRAAAYRAAGPLWAHDTGIVYKPDNPFAWDSYKDSDRHLGVSPDHTLFVVPTAGDGIVAFEAGTGARRWTIPHAATPDRPRGTPHPEIAFSADGTRVLLAPLTPAGERRVTFEIARYAIDPATGRADRKQARTEAVTVAVRAFQSELMLVDATNGKPVWRRPTGCHLFAADTGAPVWSRGQAPTLTETIGGRPYTWSGRAGDVPRDVATDRPVYEAGLELPFWHLYSAIGPAGRWCVLGTRGAHIALLDERGELLRVWEPAHLPAELDPGDMIAPTFLAGAHPGRLVAYAPQARRAFVFELALGSPEQRRRARELERRDRTTLARIEEQVNQTAHYGQFEKAEYLEAFAAGIEVPADLKKELLDRMRAVPGERRAGRKRDGRFFAPIVERIRDRLFQAAQAELDAAVGLRATGAIELGEMIADAAMDRRMETLYVGCWDGTVRAYGLDGVARWRAPVVGGCQIAVAEDGAVPVAVYAGGSRGDLYRLDPATGKIVWRINITDAACRLP